MKRIRFSPFEITMRIDDDGQWRFTASIDGRELFSDVPYHEITMATILIDALVDEELGKAQHD